MEVAAAESEPARALPAVAPPAEASTKRARRNWRIARNVWAGAKAFQSEGQKRSWSTAYFDNVLHTFTATATEIRTGGVTGTPETSPRVVVLPDLDTAAARHAVVDDAASPSPEVAIDTQLPDADAERDADAAVTAALAVALHPARPPRSIVRLTSRRLNVEEWADDHDDEGSSDGKQSEDLGEPRISPIPERPPVDAKRQPVLSAKQQAQADSCARLSSSPTRRARRFASAAAAAGNDGVAADDGDDTSAAASAPEGVVSPWRSAPSGRRLTSSVDSLSMSAAETGASGGISRSRHARLRRRRITLEPASFGYLPPCVFSVVHVAMTTPTLPQQPATACVAPSALAVVSLPRSRGGGVFLRAMSDLSAVDYAPRRPSMSAPVPAPFQRTQHSFVC